MNIYVHLLRKLLGTKHVTFRRNKFLKCDKIIKLIYSIKKLFNKFVLLRRLNSIRIKKYLRKIINAWLSNANKMQNLYALRRRIVFLEIKNIPKHFSVQQIQILLNIQIRIWIPNMTLTIIMTNYFQLKIIITKSFQHATAFLSIMAFNRWQT